MKRRLVSKKGKLIIGLTGTFGSGKSTLAVVFKSYGAKVIDADKIAHAFLRPGNSCYKKIVSLFGENILKSDKSINHASLAEKVFADKKKLVMLNSIVHPCVIKEIKEQINSIKAGTVILDAPLLIEAGLHKLTDKLVVVAVRKDVQVKRMRRKFKMSSSDVLKRINAQMPLSRKVRLADFVIDNNGDLKETKKQAKEFWEQIKCCRYNL